MSTSSPSDSDGRFLRWGRGSDPIGCNKTDADIRHMGVDQPLPPSSATTTAILKELMEELRALEQRVGRIEQRVESLAHQITLIKRIKE